MVEVTCRTLQGRFLLKPTSELKPLILGVLGRAQRRYPVEIHAFVFLSNHYHLLLSVETALQLSRFMNYLNSNLAREAGRLHGWKEKFWGRRYQAIVVTDEEAAQVDRLRYLLSHGCKEGLVARPRDWPGAHCVDALTKGDPLDGLWFNRTREYAARVQGKMNSRLEYATRETIRLEPLPCWRHLPKKSYQHRVADLIQEIEIEAAVRHAKERTRPLGSDVVLTQRTVDRPRSMKKMWAPHFHAATKSARMELIEAYKWFVGAYRDAANRMRQGDLRAFFPIGSFPPPRPFVKRIADLAPG